MNYAVEMRSGAMIYTWTFMKIDWDIQKLLGEVHAYSHGELGDFINLLLFFQSKENIQKN
jgi:hypothetical protein